MAKNLFDFVSLPWKLENPYYHSVKANNLWITGALVSAGGQWFREIGANWFVEDYNEITYSGILRMGSRYFAGLFH